MICESICGDGLVVGNEVCNAGAEIGCFSDCSKDLDGYICTGGSETSPSICSKGLNGQALTAVNSAQATAKTSAAVGSSLNALGSVT